MSEGAKWKRCLPRISLQREQGSNRREGRCTAGTGESGGGRVIPQGGPGAGKGAERQPGRDLELGSAASLVRVETAPRGEEAWSGGWSGDPDFLPKGP